MGCTFLFIEIFGVQRFLNRGENPLFIPGTVTDGSTCIVYLTLEQSKLIEALVSDKE